MCGAPQLCNGQKGANRVVMWMVAGYKVYAGHILTIRYLAYANYICLMIRLHIRALLINKYCHVGDAIFGVDDL